MTIRPTRSITAAASLAAVLLLNACGSSSDDTADTTAAATEESVAAADTTTAAETTVAAATTAAADTTAAAETTVAADTTVAPAAETTAGDAAAAGADYELVEWAINGPSSIAAGSVTFNVTNGGNFPHELVIIKGESYGALPQAASGAVEEDQLEAGALIAETARLDPGASETLTADLAAGHYILICNITGGGSSHAARGQVLEVDVA